LGQRAWSSPLKAGEACCFCVLRAAGLGVRDGLETALHDTEGTASAGDGRGLTPPAGGIMPKLKIGRTVKKRRESRQEKRKRRKKHRR